MAITLPPIEPLPNNRFANALFIQSGASNGLAVSNALVKAYKEAREDTRSTVDTNKDSAVRMILHQLSHLAGILVDGTPDYSNNPDRRWPNMMDWDKDFRVCIERCQKYHLLKMLDLENEVRLFICDYNM